MFKMNPIFFFIITSILVLAVNAQYTWRDYIRKGDILSSVVALELRGETIGTGVFISQSSVLTSANILDYLAANRSSYTHIYVHHIWGSEETKHWVWCVRTIHNWNRYRTSTDYWVRQGFDRKNSPAHDLYVLGLFGNWADTMFLLEPMIAIKRGTPMYEEYRNWGYYYWFSKNYKLIAMIDNFRYNDRPSISITPDTVLEATAVLNQKDMFYAGFACCNKGTFEDKDKTLILETNIYLVDCDEWVPREWGYFICISLKDETRVPSAGTPLFYHSYLVGMASFTMTRNEETIQVFTDVRWYYEHLWVCKPTHMNILTYHKWRYTTYITTYVMPIIMRDIGYDIAIAGEEIAKNMAKLATEIFQEASKQFENIQDFWSKSNFFG